jgi:hypothetical protein
LFVLFLIICGNLLPSKKDLFLIPIPENHGIHRSAIFPPNACASCNPELRDPGKFSLHQPMLKSHPIAAWAVKHRFYEQTL